MKKILLVWLLAAIVFLGGCKKEEKKDIIKQQDTDLFSSISPIVKVKDKLFSIPSPMQLSHYIKSLEIPYDQDLLNNPDNYTKYMTSFKQATNIGIYGADLGTLFVYDQLSLSGKYFTVIKKLSTDVGILNSLNQKLLERAQNNSNNKDSLVYLISLIYRDIDHYLLVNEQEDLGSLILAGGWIESVYYISQLIKKQYNPELVNRLAEQKTPLNNIIALMHSNYNQKSEQYDKLVEALVNLSIEFDAVEENYTYKAPETDPKNRITYIHSQTTYNISKENLEKIISSIEQIRNSLIE